jgi:hypothetical protein
LSKILVNLILYMNFQNLLLILLLNSYNFQSL